MHLGFYMIKEGFYSCVMIFEEYVYYQVIALVNIYEITVIPQLTKIISSRITFVSRNLR